MVLPDRLLGTGKIPGKPALILAPRNGYSTVSIQVTLVTDGRMSIHICVFAHFVLSWQQWVLGGGGMWSLAGEIRSQNTKGSFLSCLCFLIFGNVGK